MRLGENHEAYRRGGEKQVESVYTGSSEGNQERLRPWSRAIADGGSTKQRGRVLKAKAPEFAFVGKGQAEEESALTQRGT
jgi:hypothetical protein